MEPALRLCSALPGAQRLGRRMGQLPPPHLLQGKLAPAVHSAFSPIPWLCIMESLRGILSPTPHFYSSIRFIHSPLGAVAPPISFSPPFAFPPPPPALSSLPPTAPILFYVRPLGLFARRTPHMSAFPSSLFPCRPCGAICAPSASATDCRARARCAPAGRSCPRSARWARGCSSASTAPRVSWAPTMAKLCCPPSSVSSRRAALTYSTPPTRLTSAPPTGARAPPARAAAPATAVPRTSAAATCCAAAAGTARRACSSRRTACVASTGAA